MLKEVTASYLRCLELHVELVEDVETKLELLTK
jgi:hypothetical protein